MNRAEALELAVRFAAPGTDAVIIIQEATKLLNFANGPDTPSPAGQPPVPPAQTVTTSTTAPAPARRGRGRPVAGEAPPAPEASLVAVATLETPALVAIATHEVDPFATGTVAPPVPTATQEEVGAALRTLSAATTQDKALAILKTVGEATNLTALKPEKYGLVVAAAKAAMPAPTPAAAPAAPEDPFALPTAAPAKVYTAQEVKDIITKAQGWTSPDKLMKIVFDHGGQAKNPDTGVLGASLKALPVEKYAAVVAAIEALPRTK